MSIQSPMGKVCAGALLLVLSNAGLAESLQDRLFVEGIYGQGFVDTDRAGEVDVDQISITAGYKIDANFFAEAAFADMDFEGEANSMLLKFNGGYKHRFSRDLAGYATAGLAYWDSSDFDETEVGYSIGAGIVWGDSQIQYKAGYEYFGSFESDALFDVIHVTSIGVRYNLGKMPTYRKSYLFERFGWTQERGAGTGSLEGTTACQKEHQDLFFLCDEVEESAE